MKALKEGRDLANWTRYIMVSFIFLEGQTRMYVVVAK